MREKGRVEKGEKKYRKENDMGEKWWEKRITQKGEERREWGEGRK